MTTMPTRRLGGLKVGAIGLGEMPMSLAGRPSVSAIDRSSVARAPGAGPGEDVP